MQSALEHNSLPHRVSVRLTRSVAIFFVVLLAGVGYRFVNPPQPTEVFSSLEDFQLELRKAKNRSRLLSYTWHNTGTVASVEQVCNLAAGKARLVVHDGAGKQVYSRDLSEYGIFFTNAGTAGKWTIQVVFEKEADRNSSAKLKLKKDQRGIMP